MTSSPTDLDHVEFVAYDRLTEAAAILEQATE